MCELLFTNIARNVYGNAAFGNRTWYSNKKTGLKRLTTAWGGIVTNLEERCVTRTFRGHCAIKTSEPRAVSA